VGAQLRTSRSSSSVGMDCICVSVSVVQPIAVMLSRSCCGQPGTAASAARSGRIEGASAPLTLIFRALRSLFRSSALCAWLWNAGGFGASLSVLLPQTPKQEAQRVPRIDGKASAPLKSPALHHWPRSAEQSKGLTCCRHPHSASSARLGSGSIPAT
jgi:hypothetical protein